MYKSRCKVKIHNFLPKPDVLYGSQTWKYGGVWKQKLSSWVPVRDKIKYDKLREQFKVYSAAGIVENIQ
jgi:hypothetical protein